MLSRTDNLDQVITLHSSQYTGKVTPESTHGCQLIARKLGDIYSTENRRFTRSPFLENNYMEIIKNETEASRTLIAFGESSILPGVIDYITHIRSYEQSRPEVLREKVAYKYSTSDWENLGGLTGKSFNQDSIKIYTVLESGSTPGSKSPTQLYLVFAPVDVTEAGKILLYLSRNHDMYSYNSYLSVKDLPVSSGLDFQHLFPVELKYFQDYTLISSDQFTQSSLNHLWMFREVKFPFPDIDPLRGEYAAYLLSESMYYNFLVGWDQGNLVLGLCGWLQMNDLLEHYTKILNDLNRENIVFEELTDLQTTKISKFKSFYHNGTYYRATIKTPPSDEPIVTPVITGLPNKLSTSKNLNDSLHEFLNPLRSVVSVNRISALQYLKRLGYSITPNPIPYQNNIRLGYRTYLNETTNETFTVYYYLTTHNEEMEIHETIGKANDEIKDILEWALQQGYFFTREMQNITQGYPEFIPGIPPINRNLSKYPDQLIQQIKNLKFK
jgi:hypothetical protein